MIILSFKYQPCEAPTVSALVYLQLFQIIRRRSTGCCDRRGWTTIIKQNNLSKNRTENNRELRKHDSDKDSVGEEKLSYSDSDETDSTDDEGPEIFLAIPSLVPNNNKN